MPPALRYSLALLFVGLAVLLRCFLWPLLGSEIPFLFLWPAVLLAAWCGGLGPGLVATLLAALTEDYMLLGPGSLGTGTPQEKAGLVLFILLGSSLSLLLDRLQRSRQQEEQHREWLRATLASIGDAVVATDREGRVAFLNAVAQALTGWKQDEVVGQPLDQVLHFVQEPTGRAIESPVQRVIQTQGVVELGHATSLVARGGTVTPIDCSAAPIRTDEGGLRGVVLVFRDTTEKRRLENALRQRAEQLAEADRRKSEFLAMLSHELRNPLAPIRNAIRLLRRPGTPASERPWAEALLERQVGQLTRLVDDLLDVSRIGRGRIRLQKEPVELAEVLERGVELSRPLLEDRRHELIESLPAEPVWLAADRTRLVQVFANLLTNAAKYTDEGGRILLAATREGEAVVVRVRDNGIGMAPEMLARVFDLFVQADRSLDRSQGGLGIGLTLVKSLVELHGGTVQAHSDGPGHGSEFVVRLPVLAEAPPPATEQQPTVRVPARRILVVDDQREAAESLALVLRAEGHEVATAYEGLAALETAGRWKPEVVLLDIEMPGLNGYEVARRLRQLSGLEGVALVALTGYGQEEDRRRTKEAGFDEHLVKPVEPEAFHSLLSSLAPAVT